MRTKSGMTTYQIPFSRGSLFGMPRVRTHFILTAQVDQNLCFPYPALLDAGLVCRPAAKENNMKTEHNWSSFGRIYPSFICAFFCLVLKLAIGVFKCYNISG